MKKVWKNISIFKGFTIELCSYIQVFIIQVSILVYLFIHQSVRLFLHVSSVHTSVDHGRFVDVSSLSLVFLNIVEIPARIS